MPHVTNRQLQQQVSAMAVAHPTPATVGSHRQLPAPQPAIRLCSTVTAAFLAADETGSNCQNLLQQGCAQILMLAHFHLGCRACLAAEVLGEESKSRNWGGRREYLLNRLAQEQGACYIQLLPKCNCCTGVTQHSWVVTPLKKKGSGSEEERRC